MEQGRDTAKIVEDYADLTQDYEQLQRDSAAEIESLKDDIGRLKKQVKDTRAVVER